MGPLDRRLEPFRRDLAHTRQLAALAYEAAQRWPDRLEQIRADPGYETAYTEREPLVTVRIATYNNWRILCERALASVRAQTYDNWEAVVVGDCCTDDTAERVARLGDERIRFINLPYRQPYPEDELERWRVTGINAMNAGLRAARGRWVCPLDHDDEFAPDHIEHLLAVAQQERAEVAYGKLAVVDAATGEPKDTNISDWPPQRTKFNWLSAITHSGLRQFEFDPYCVHTGEVADWNLCRRLLDTGVRFHHTDKVVGTYWSRH